MLQVVKGSAFYSAEDRQMIDVTIVVDGVRMPYTATPTDVEDDCREIYTRAVFGEYGEVKPYVAPTPIPATTPTAEELLRQIAALQRQVQALTEN